ncbi:MAG: RagB/SusD family nutrient uptake outer membrane protein [Bacteroidales bacterium]|nr:RagB/SusD family nutrient uptake outer membrane protein [Bacteroidales bacterium]
MKLYKYLIIITAFMLFSCEEFLREEYMSGENSETIVSSEENMELLINSVYVPLRIWYGAENGWDLTEAGTDLYTRGEDNRARGFCTYEGLVGEEQDRMAAVWYELYKGLNACNLAIENLPDLEYTDPVVQDNRMGELLFLRAHTLWQIVELWGPVHFTTEPVTGAVYTANKTPINVFYDQIFQDLGNALQLLPETAAEYSRIDQAICKAFKARIHLMWASYKKEGFSFSGNEYISADAAVAQQHYDSALQLASAVINDYDYQLLSDWDDIWSIDNIMNDEVIWAINYSANSQYTTANLMNPWDEDYWDENETNPDDFRYNTFYIVQREGGNMGHLMWEIRTEDLDYGVQRTVVSGRGFQRWMPTKFFIDLYDETIDQRFYGSFKTAWICNDEATIPAWVPFYYQDGVRIDVPQELWTTRKFELGDTAIVFSKQPVPESEKARQTPTALRASHPEKGYLILDINDMYLEDGTPNDDVISRQFYFPITKRYMDTTRENAMQQYSGRDAYAIRLPEMYLIAAEAALETGSSTDAYSFLLDLANARAYEGLGAGMLAAYGVSSGDDIDIDFILDERARELATENLRFFDLKRTGKLLERVRAHNTDASPNIQEYHQLRFIPQEQLDAVRNPDEFFQNPGY